MFTASIKEDECIGCSRCISVCPVDAIVGANKFVHTVLLDECIGCKLCLAPCPVDCIDILPLEKALPNDTHINKPARAEKAKLRHRNRSNRLKQEAQSLLPSYANDEERKTNIKSSIASILARTKNKRKQA